MKKKIFSFWIEGDLKTVLMKQAKEKDITMAKLLNRLIREKLNESTTTD